MIILLCGIPGAGKSTIARHLGRMLRRYGIAKKVARLQPLAVVKG